MKRLAFVLLIVMIASLVVGPSALADKGGNLAPAGTHYNLNIIGVDAAHAKTADMTDSNRHTIFVNLNGKCNIYLQKAPTGETFKVIDGNCFTVSDRSGTGSDPVPFGAAFQLPPPDATEDGTLDYSVWVRVPPGQKGSATMTTCYYDTADAASYCMDGNAVPLSAKKTFTDVSKELLTVCANLAAAGATPDWKTVPLFYSGEDGPYWWEYDNQGLKLAQLRFYPKVSGGDYGFMSPCFDKYQPTRR